MKSRPVRSSCLFWTTVFILSLHHCGLLPVWCRDRWLRKTLQKIRHFTSVMPHILNLPILNYIITIITGACARAQTFQPSVNINTHWKQSCNSFANCAEAKIQHSCHPCNLDVFSIWLSKVGLSSPAPLKRFLELLYVSLLPLLLWPLNFSLQTWSCLLCFFKFNLTLLD